MLKAELKYLNFLPGEEQQHLYALSIKGETNAEKEILQKMSQHFMLAHFYEDEGKLVALENLNSAN